ncbi:TlpA family protein disulfide reductase [Algoriphagus aestuariicola]|uniref:TlpA family protein disulfide reductase n=1 Tax=Algoriphagus aestuariicola TaxID=1852016 RepID=A0ABS3BJH2_9BACT|nr:peroxiredoxin family protein [Algoriphagus aestuariicola]MBN7799443.1 TlpA family protein disulfide reductase [Algoriphagus aestuariicola]
MKVFYILGMVFLLFSCSAPQSPEEIFAAARQNLKSSGQVQFRQEMVWESPSLEEFDTIRYTIDFRKNPKAFFGYDFVGSRDGFESRYVEGIEYGIDHQDSTVKTADVLDSTRIQYSMLRTFNPLVLFENDPWKYIGDTTIQQQKLLQYMWVEMDTVIMDKKVYLENHLWINPANLLPEFYSRRLYHDGQRNQLIESTYEDWVLEEKAEPFVLDFPKGYLTKVEGSTESPLLKVGTQAPDFELEDANGNLVKLSDFRGKKVLLDFSIINCGWCKIALEQFAKEDYKFADDIVPLYVNPEDSWEKLKKYQSRVTVPFPILADAKEVGKEYGVNGFPTFYLIDETGKIEEVAQGYSDEKILEWKRKSE